MKTDEPILVHPLEVRGETFEVRVREDGLFLASFEGRKFATTTREELRSKLLDATKRRKAVLSIPFSCLYAGKVRRGTVTGIHATTGNLLVAWSDGTKEQHSTVGGDHLRPLSDQEAIDLEELLVAQAAARKAVHDFVAARKMPLFSIARTAEDAAVKADQKE